MIDRRQFVVLGVAAAGAGPALSRVALPSNRRSAEIRSFRAFAETTHPRGREAAADQDWRARWTKLEAEADRLSDGAYYVELRRAFGWFGDGHTTVLPFEFVGGVPDALKTGPFGQELPVSIRTYHDGAFVTAAAEPAVALLGQRIDRIGTMSTIDFMRAHAAHWPGNQAWSHRWAGPEMSSPALLQGFGAIMDPGQPVTLAGESGSVDLPPRPHGTGGLTQIDRQATAREGWAKEAGGGNYVRALGDGHALYISIDDMDDVEGKTFEQLTRDAFGAMAEPGFERMIVDLRRNGGGNNFLGEPLRKGVAASRFNRPGGLYVLISPVTFSAAQNLANRLERETFAIFVGEPTGGAPNHYGDAKIINGAVTGITAMVSTIPWFDSYPQDQRAWIMPDLPVPQTFADWRSGRDRGLEITLAHQPGGSAEFLSRDQIFYFNRRSQKAGWKPFWL